MVNMLKFETQDMVRYFQERNLSDVNSYLFTDGMVPSIYGIVELHPDQDSARSCKQAIDLVAMPIYVFSASIVPAEFRKSIRLDPTSRLPIDKESGQAWGRLCRWLDRSSKDVPPLSVEGEMDVLEVLERGRDPNYFNFKQWIDDNSGIDRVVSAELLRERRIPELYAGLHKLAEIPDDLDVGSAEIRQRYDQEDNKGKFRITLWDKVKSDLRHLNYRIVSRE